MNKLKEYAGLLNEVAPENHFLAYITADERDMLVDVGGKKTSTPSGIFAYPPPGEKASLMKMSIRSISLMLWFSS